jgi:ribosomal protein L11 methyltransferase
LDHLELIIDIRPYSDETRDILIAQLSRIGFHGFLEEGESLSAFQPFKAFDKKLLEEVLNLPCFYGIDFTVRTLSLEDKNWNKLWESNYPPLVVDKKCLIRAPFHPTIAGIEYELIIEPKMSFGTGHHPTTRLMVSEILGMDLHDKSILDIGSGTGILSILASMKGAKDVTAIDNDTWAFKNCKENIERNKIRNVQTFLGDTSLIKKTSFHAVFANINKLVIVSELFHWINLTEQNGFVLISGFLKDDIADIKNLFRKRLIHIKTRVSGNWAMMVLQKPFPN